MVESAYVPGVCNINRAEIAYRRKWAYYSLVVFIIGGGVLLSVGVSSWLRLVLFLPAFVSTINFLQVRNKFCVSYAASGMQNAVEGSKDAQRVNAAAHKKDTAKARTMNFQAFVVAAAATLALTSI